MRLGAQVDCIDAVFRPIRYDVRDDGLAVGRKLCAVVTVARDVRDVVAIEPNDVIAIQVLDHRRVLRAVFEPACVVPLRFCVIDWPVPHVHVRVRCAVEKQARIPLRRCRGVGAGRRRRFGACVSRCVRTASRVGVRAAGDSECECDQN